MLRRILLVMALSLAGWAAQAFPAEPPPECTLCNTWNAPQTPFRIYGNTYYVGVHGLSSLLIDSGDGLVLIDGDTPWSPPQIEAHIKALGFDPEDVPTIFNEKALAVSRWGTLKIDHKSFMTSLPGVFAAGDIVRGASLVVWAIKDGRDAAAQIALYMRQNATMPVAAE